MNDVYRDFPFSEEGKKLNLSDDLFEKCKVIYKENTENGTWEFAGFWNGNKTEELRRMIVPVQSVYGGWVDVNPETDFVNVVGSSSDPIPLLENSWIALLRNIYAHIGYNYDGTCCAGNRIFTLRAGSAFDNLVELNCHGNIVGGHVLINQKQNVIAYPNSTVYLLPICNCHNIYRVGNGSAGTGFFMRTDRRLPAIQLDAFLHDDYLSRVEKWCHTNGFPFPPPFPIN